MSNTFSGLRPRLQTLTVLAVRIEDAEWIAPLVAQVVAIVPIIIAVLIVHSFLFRAEGPPVSFIVGLVVYAAIIYTLAVRRLIGNFFSMIDGNTGCTREAALLAFVPPIIVTLTSGIHISSPTVLIVFSLTCALYMFLVERITSALYRISPSSVARKLMSKTSVVWLIGVLVLVSHVYYSPTLNADFTRVRDIAQYNNFQSYIASSQTYYESGVLFTARTDDSTDGKTPRYLRFEEINGGDDVGYAILQAIALYFELDPSPRTNMLINRAVFLAGSILLAVVAGSFLVQSALGPLCIGLALFYSHASFFGYLYRFLDQHGAAVGLGLIGLAFLSILPLVVRKWSFSALVWIGLAAGSLAGVLALIRQNVGLSFLAACFVAVVLVAAQRSRRLTITLALALLCGNALVGLSLDSLFAYRDAKLRIDTPIRSDAAHGAWFSLLGGTGARQASAFGVTWNDGVIWRTLENEAPLLEWKDTEPLARTIMLRYVREHTSEFVEEFLQKAHLFVALVVDGAAKTWGTGLLVLLIVASVAIPVEFVSRGARAPMAQAEPPIGPWEGIMSCLLFVGATAVVPVLTQPEHFVGETIVVLFGTIAIAVFASSFWLLGRALEQR